MKRKFGSMTSEMEATPAIPTQRASPRVWHFYHAGEVQF